MQQRDGFAGNTFAAAGKTEFLGGGSFDVDVIHIAAEIFGNKHAHLWDMRRHFRRVSDNRHVHVPEGKTFGLNTTPGFAQQFAAVRPLESRIGVREQFANIPQRGGTQQRIGQGMQSNVTVRMSQQPFFERDTNAANNNRANAAKSNNLELSTLTIHNTMLCFDQASRQFELDRICVMFDLANELGISTVRPVSGHEDDLSEAQQAIPEEEKLQAVIEMCRLLVPQARKRNLTFALEPHPGVTWKLDNVIKLYDAIQDEEFKLQFDAKHVDCSPLRALSTPSLLKRLGGIHFDNYVVSYPNICLGNVPINDGVLDNEPFFKVLQQANYNGWITIEYCGNTQAHITTNIKYIQQMAKKYNLS